MFAERLLQRDCTSERDETYVAALRKFAVPCGCLGQGGRTNRKCTWGCFEEVVVREGFSEEVTLELSSE